MSDGSKKYEYYSWGCAFLLIAPGLIITVIGVVKLISNDAPLINTIWFGLSGLVASFHIHPGILGILLVVGIVYLVNFFIKKVFGENSITIFWHSIYAMIISLVFAFIVLKLFLWIFRGVGLFHNINDEENILLPFSIIYCIILPFLVYIIIKENKNE